MAPDLAVVAVAVFLPFVAAALAPLLYRALGEHVGYAGALVGRLDGEVPGIADGPVRGERGSR